MRKKRSARLMLGTVVLAALAIFGCSSGDLASLFGGGAQGEWVGSSASPSGTGGQSWNLTIDHTANTFSATNVTANKHYSGTINLPPTGFLETVTTTSDDATLTLPATGHSLEIPGDFIALKVDDSGSDVTPLVNSGGVCPTFASPKTYNFVRFGFKNGFDATTDKTRSKVTFTQTGPTTYSLQDDGFKMDGTSTGPTETTTLTCNAGQLIDPNGGGGAISTDQEIAIGDPPGTHSEAGAPRPASAVTIATLVAAQYSGFRFIDGNPGVTEHVGFGPGAGTAISGGTFANLHTSAFNTHATNVTITFTGQPENGLLTCSVADGNGVHTPCVASVGRAKNKFQIFVFTTDTSPTVPYHIFLSQN